METGKSRELDVGHEEGSFAEDKSLLLCPDAGSTRRLERELERRFRGVASVRRAWLALLVFAALIPAGAFSGQEAAADRAFEPNDYSEGSTWLCLPEREDACAIDHTTTVIEADGTFLREEWSADPESPIDCFYVYPTVSPGPGLQSDMNPGEGEIDAVRQQFARFASKCRPFAPVYRQFTTAAFAAGEADALGVGFDDVMDAWKYYLEHHNDGRGFVLVGHSQGAAVLTELIGQEIDGRPIQSQMVSAFLIGATVPVAKGRDVGGAFEHVPVCRSPSQTGCVISYVAFRATAPPPADTLFGRVDEPGLEAICTHPAALDGGTGALHAYLATDGRMIGLTTAPGPWVTPERPVETPWVSVPGLLTASCTSNEFASYLEVTVHGDPEDARTDDIVGDVGPPWPPCPQCGLHLVDLNLAMGNLLDLVEQQKQAWLAAQR